MTEASSSGPTNGTGIEVSLLEKRLEGLRDTQESVQGLSLWCQANKKHSTPIIDTWLRVLRRSPVEKRLTMFYLANDVVQHAKRKGDLTVVNQWAVAVQKATPHVRSPSSVSTAIIRIFKIWEERSVYSKDTVADLIALVSKHNSSAKERTQDSKKKPEIYTARDEKVKAFQCSSFTGTIKQAYRLKSHLGVTFRTKQYFNMNMEQLIASIKDRQHGMSVIENMSELLDACRMSENKLVHEVEERRKIVEAAEVAIVFYENVRAEARIVNSAYKNFTERVVRTKQKVDEMMRAFAEMEGSPIPSPDRLSPYDEIQVLLPPIAEFEARQAQASNLIEVVQTNSSTHAEVDSSSFNETQYPSNTGEPTNMVSGMLPSGTAYDLMSASQWPNYALQLQMMQQQVAQAFAYHSDPNHIQQQHQQQQQTSPDIDSIPLPPDGGLNIKPMSHSQQSIPKSESQSLLSLPLQSPGPSSSSTPGSLPSTPYEPNHILHTPSSAISDYSNNDYQSQAYDSYFDIEQSEGGNEYDDTPNFNSTPNNSTATRYHPYNNSTPRRDRRVSEGTTGPRARPPRFSAQSPQTQFRPPPFNPMNPNTTPLRPRFPSFTGQSDTAPGAPRPRPHNELPNQHQSSGITTNLLRLAQMDQPLQQEAPLPYTFNSKLYVTEEVEQRLNGGEEEEFEGYEKPQQFFTPRGRGGIAQVRSPRGLKPPMRGIGRGRGIFGGGGPGFRGPRARGNPSPRRGNYFIL